MASRLVGEDIPTAPDISLEFDIVDQHCTADIFSFDHEIPSRPTSRLGFNRVRMLKSPLTEEEFLEEVHPESLFETAKPERPRLAPRGWTSPADVDMDITNFISERDNGSQTPSETVIPSLFSPTGCPNTPDDACLSSSDDELDSDYSSYDESDDESGTTSLSPTSTTDSITTPFSHIPEESDWSIRPKYSSLPSPLSPRYVPPCAFSYRHTPQRHCYRHHGHSRHALHHLKWFWATREDRWMEYKTRLCEVKAYDGLSIFGSVSPGLRLPSDYLTPDTTDTDTPRPPASPPMAHLPPLSIHPRRGDLCALRDPYCMHIDRYFVGMPMWTMAKTLWMFDVHMASGDLRLLVEDEVEGEDDLFEEDQSEDESIETSGSHVFSDDSDSTLVESESERDIPRCADGAREPDPSASAHPEKDKSDSDLSTSSLSSSTAFKADDSSPPRSRWATSWYRRWEVLLQLCIENNSDVVAELDVPSTTSPVKSRRFFIVDDWNDLGPDEDDEEEAEEEVSTPNVLVVVNDDSSEGRPLRRCRY